MMNCQNIVDGVCNKKVPPTRCAETCPFYLPAIKIETPPKVETPVVEPEPPQEETKPKRKRGIALKRINRLPKEDTK